MAKIFTFNSTNVIDYTICILFVSHDYYTKCMTEPPVKIMMTRLDIYMINDCNSVTLEGNGNPLQYSWLANPKDGGAWQAAVLGVAKSRT